MAHNFFSFLICLFVLWVNMDVYAQTGNIKNVRERAYAGDAKAMIELSNYYKNKGKDELANMWLDKAKSAEPEAVKKIRDAEKVANEVKKGTLKDYFKHAYNNNPLAMVRVGNCYDNGEDVAVNKDEALRWYRKAQAIDESLLFEYMVLKGEASRLIMSEIANKGNTEAMIRLGETSSSDAEAHKWYKMAAAKGDRRGKQKSDELYAQRKAEQEAEEERAESQERSRANYRASWQNMAGFWTCRNTIVHYQIYSDGRAYFRNGSGSVWRQLQVEYLGSNKFRGYDTEKWIYFRLNGNQLIVNDNNVYYRR